MKCKVAHRVLKADGGFIDYGQGQEITGSEIVDPSPALWDITPQPPAEQPAAATDAEVVNDSEVTG